MSGTLVVRNRQSTTGVDLRLLRRMSRTLLIELLRRKQFNIGIYLVGEKEMVPLNETFLRHRGSTDVITFNYGELGFSGTLCGEIFVCVDQALVQAEKYRTTWQSELVRYVVHGVLHLSGYDDLRANDRTKMKREEDRLLRRLAGQFVLGNLGGPRRAAQSPRDFVGRD